MVFAFLVHKLPAMLQKSGKDLKKAGDRKPVTG